MTSPVRVLIGTRRGLFIAHSATDRTDWELSEPLLDGREVYCVANDERTGALWAASRHSVWGAHLHRSDDGGVSWHILEDAPRFEDGRGLVAVWSIAPGGRSRPGRIFAGTEPAGLFVSEDQGRSWVPVSGLNQHATAGTWQPAGGALALHSIALDPRDDDRIWCAVSAGGVYRSDDGGRTWHARNQGVRAEFLPTRFPAAGQCVHRLIVHPADPDRLYQQNHCGVYRSDDRGDTWTEITEGLPSDFGYALATDPADPDSLFVVPEESSHMRTVHGGRLAVWATRDGGRTWAANGTGLPDRNAYVSVLREGLAFDSLDPVGLYLGTSGGHVFVSSDAGGSWTMIAGFLPRVLSVGVVVSS
ncbi:MAG: hypothetical protein PVH00_09810 [Gemmatimonadota bacterium]|jgi:photosystem II stability/assembly factor-like uncharacterized protein